ncbi:MAG TPA: hypothetical protein RMH85_28110 [Polyangiaceae bacterium LLY-WYZ-15_(1-7)]|nr:hypothetical protein [Myxococcales bacterium]MAT23906.1 hypothetical protein [Sandaracinus sp.]HJK91608.1 hypothetical protein [Polyangiaceae bacterium LLY-WYZ-15_(1-7)]MBJ71195.1 hypothetical protein [Sandaracinus sp.]HJL00523.1 hypothetical protein [Polyangiaceae bacterium LLY-WYZ-15_(1-7)]
MSLVGVNTPYLQGEYGHDLAPNGRFPEWPVAFSEMAAYRPLIEAAELGFDAIRLWLCENGEGIVLDERGAIAGVHADLLKAVEIVSEAAALHGLRVYWSLLDGNAIAREADPVTRAIVTDGDARARFAEKVVAPIAGLLDPRLTVALEIVNEPETGTEACMRDSDEVAEGAEAVTWEQLGATIRLAGDAARAEGVAHVTAGTMHVFLPELWKVDPRLDAVDVHVYHPRGGLPSRADLAAYVGDDALKDPALPLFGGECGIPKGADESTLPLLNYVHNAEAAGYDGVFLWQLEGDLVDKGAPKRPITELGWEAKRLLAERRG